MRRKDISLEFTNVNSKLIEEAAEYRSSGKKLVRVLALAACFAVLVTAIPLSLIMNREDQAETPETTLTPGKDSTTDTVIVDPKPLKVIYCDASSVSPQYLEANVFKNKNIKVENFVSYGRPVEWKEEYGTIPRSEDIPEKLTLNLSSKEIIANFDIAYNANSNSSNDNLKKLEQIARYKIEGTEKAYIYYCIVANKIVKIDRLPIDTSFMVPSYTPKYTIEEIEELARQDIKSIYGEEILKKYSKISSASIGGFFHVVFERMIGDYDTGSFIMMTYAWSGELFDCLLEQLEDYYFAEHLLNEKKLLEVEEEARQLIGKDFVAEKKLMLHKDGYVCVRYILYLGYNETGSITGTAYLYFRLE